VELYVHSPNTPSWCDALLESTGITSKLSLGLSTMKTNGGVEVKLHTFLISALDGGE
jgi:hypothetical protein